MEVTVMMPTKVEIEKIVIDLHIRYVGDTEDDDVPTDFPGLEGNNWKAVVMIGSGQILGWPEGEEREMYCKVCDAGIYTLFDASGNSVGEIAGYVPHGVVPGDWGDYVHLKISGDGVITNWPSNPDVSAFFDDNPLA
jgi:hypothetical protein